MSGHSQKCGVSSQAISGTIFQAFNAWERCWKKLSGQPRFKGKRNRLNSFQFPGDCNIDVANSKIKLPKLGWICFHAFTGGLPEGKIAATVRVIKKPSGLYAVVIFKEAEHQQVVLASETQVGIDTGFKDLLTLSNGEVYKKPVELANSADQLAKAQRGGSRKQAARIQEKIGRQRKDRNHKISHALVQVYQEIYITNDHLRGMAKRFGKSVASSGLAQLRQFILYKGRSCGRVVELVESKNTTRTCSSCDALTGPSGLSKLNVRHWVCTSCGACHDRDINAAINILKAGVRYTLEKKVGKNKIKLTQLKKTKHAPAA
ncbi:MAG: RNA-guided endonuclease InsQ/TnpB family protein [Bdellovibrionia bacterium]